MSLDKLSPENRELLSLEQANVIASSEPRLLVIAGPGSGKTHTITKRIAKELESLPDHQGVVACSFTTEASRQLKISVEKATFVKRSFIGTFDSFVLREFVDPFRNRFLSLHNLAGSNEKLEYRISNTNETNSFLRWYPNGFASEEKKLEIYHSWIDLLGKGICEISFAAYLMAEECLRCMPQVSKYLSSVYRSIYIDEAQDLNVFQLKLITTILETTSLKCVMVGDPNQSVYEFRGSRPELFLGLEQAGFIKLQISVSVRCHPDILSFANAVVQNCPASHFPDKTRVALLTDIPSSLIEEGTGSFFILTDTNAEARTLCKKYQEDGIDVVYSCKISLEEYGDFAAAYQSLIEECLLFFYNWDKRSPILGYSFDDFRSMLEIYKDRIRDRDIPMPGRFSLPVSFIREIFRLLKITLPKDVEARLIEETKKNEVTDYYRRDREKNRCMTIHAAKGLEADRVYVVFTSSPYKNGTIQKESLRKAFVAFTRAREQLFISTHGTRASSWEQYLKCFLP